jgi:hypothetical protein
MKYKYLPPAAGPADFGIPFVLRKNGSPASRRHPPVILDAHKVLFNYIVAVYGLVPYNVWKQV